MKEYNPKIVEKKWQDHWYNNKLFKAVDFDSTRKKYFALLEFPYPSGVGMHVGHVRAYSSLEVVARKRRMEGYNVLFPIGFDAFGLPTENYAIKTGIHPRKVTDDNIKTFTKQLKDAGFSFDFDRVVDTTDEHYYKWTQWIFKQMHDRDLAYRNKTYVNFCPNCQVILANEESQGGKCDRCDSEVVQMEKDVWFLKITKYAEGLLQGLSDVDYLPRIKSEQENWIGKSIGAHIEFKIKDSIEELKVFTTRADTIYGVTFMVIAPEHDLIETLKAQITNLDEIKAYQEQTKRKSEFERLNLTKDKTGVLINGIKAINPLSNKEIPVFIADYVLMGYGTGAIMAVPGHDERDYEFAKKFDLDIIEVISGGDITKEAFTDIENGTLVNSEIINGLSVTEAKAKMIAYLRDHKLGDEAINYRMQDWAFNRQRYWGEPIPIIYCDKCGEVTVNDEDLPVKLPHVDHFQPSSSGESPLANIKEFIETTCPKCGGKGRRETDTMPQWAGSSWYFLRYCDPFNDQQLASMDKLNYWMPVDWYNGGMEHVTRHMIYSRFYHHFLYDIGAVPSKEPYLKRTAQGLILGPDGEKMSKSRGNVVDPATIIEEFGADTLRTYILFIGDYEQSTPWNDNGVKGCRRFLDRVYKLFDKVIEGADYSLSIENLMHITIKEVSTDIELMKFNTAISKLMILSNELNKLEQITKKDYETLIKLINPFAPHICEELNEMLGNNDSLVFASWPVYDEDKAHYDEVEIAVQVNGKLRGTFRIARDASDKELEEAALKIENVINNIADKTIRKIITVPNRIVNIVVG